MKRLYFKYPFMIIASALLSLLSYSCSDDLEYNGTTRVEEGLPATVSLKIKVNDMGVQTRSIVDEASANYCNNLWIGLYSKETDKRIDYFYTTSVAQTSEEAGKFYDITFNTSSANDVYIVAVANSDVNTGVLSASKYSGNETSTLRELLDEATTFTRFKNLCVLRPDAADVNVYANSLTMSGWYRTADNSDLQTVNIREGLNTLSDGAIYLKRILAYNKFIIKPGANVNLTLNTWRVCNIPAGCYVMEQPDENAGDDYSGSASFFNSSLKSHQFTTTGSDGGKYFEFYQVENQHQAVDYDVDGDSYVGINPDATDYYAEREREFKNAVSGSDNKVTNSGVYRSLVNSKKTNMSNNDASYVVVNATVDYYIPADAKAEEAEPVDPATYQGETIHRYATVDYTIHLGYCEDKDSEDQPTLETAQDFNCRRNTKYTYNVTINGVKNIVVEAKKEGEDQPGAEGWVKDETGGFETLDSHYCEFNICLTDAEREKMSYRITAPYDGQYYYFIRDKDGNKTFTEGMNKEQYEWIQFYPTTEGVLASYNGGKGPDDTGLWTIDDMCHPTAKNSGGEDDNTEKWYTVFVDEYVYHFDDDGSGAETSWYKYVNQDNRLVEFIMNVDESEDSESSYTYCKYAFAQKSIQTFYKGISAGQTAVGVEHIEETYCLNMNWNYLISSGSNGTKERDASVYDYTNGRYNLTHYLEAKNITDWSDVIQESVPGHVDKGENYGCTHPAADYPVYMPKNGAGRASNPPSNNDGNAYYANSICMNRNRDENGNGKIDQDEIKWFLPTSSMYIQIAVAQSELPDPILRFTDYTPDYFLPGFQASGASERSGTFNFHYITSDYQYFFAEESVTTGNTPFNGYSGGWDCAAYTARCVRNLGTDLNEPPVKDTPEVNNAFSYNEKTRTFTQSNFTDESLRGYTLGGIAPHDVSSPSARPYKKFEVAKNFCKNMSDGYISLDSNGGASFTNWSNTGTNTANYEYLVPGWTNTLKLNTFCGQYSQETDKSDLGTWRIPTSCELALMWVQGILQGQGHQLTCSYNYFYSYAMKDDYVENPDTRTYLGYVDDGTRKVLAMDLFGYWNHYYTGGMKIRCVRDVKD
jgi:hypothetical protein